LTEHLLETELVTDGVLAQDTTQLQSLWAVRETIGESAGKAGSVYKYDVSVPVGQMYDVVEKVRTRLGEAGLLGNDWEGRRGVYEGGRVLAAMGYGHMGDGMSVNILAVTIADQQVTFISMWLPISMTTRSRRCLSHISTRSSVSNKDQKPCLIALTLS
jgi:FAD/FMN-containing dehydrogenase